MTDHDDLLGGDLGPPASAESLEGVMRRHLRRRRRFTGAVAAAVAAVGVGGGAAIGAIVAAGGGQAALGPRATSPQIGNGVGGSTVEIAGASATAGPTSPQSGLFAGPSGLEFASGGEPLTTVPSTGPATACTGASCSGSGFHGNGAGGSVPVAGGGLRRLFDRTAGGITVRAFVEDIYPVVVQPSVPAVAPSSVAPSSGAPSSGAPSSGAPSSGATSSAGSTSAAGAPSVALPVCSASSQLLVEVSDGGAVGTVSVDLSAKPTRTVDVVDEQVVGAAEGSPMAVLVVQVGNRVQRVSATFAGGATDAMAVDDGIAVLVAPLPSGSAAPDAAARANVELTGAAGKVVERFGIASVPTFGFPSACFALQGAVPGSGGAAGSSSGASTGSAGAAGSAG